MHTMEKIVGCRMLVFLVSAIGLMDISNASAQIFQWPVSPENRANLSQDYAQYNLLGNDELHTALDISAPKNTSVCAAAAGNIIMIQENGGTISNSTQQVCHEPISGEGGYCRDHGYGSTVIIEHDLGNGTKIYSHYSHLASIKESLKQDCGPLNSKNRRICPTTNPVSVTPGCPEGKVGEVGCTRYGQSDCGSSFGAHLHFEVKSFSKLGTAGNDDGEFGYTPDHPDNYGYFDPMLYLHSTIASLSPIIVIDGDPGLRARPGPSLTYPNLISVDVGQKFIAFNKSGDWYQIHLSALAKGTGVADEWVNMCCITEDSSAEQLEIQETGPGGLSVRLTANKNATRIAKVWDKQRFVILDTKGVANSGCSDNDWYMINTPRNIISSTGVGWVCGAWAVPLSGPAPSPPATNPIAIQDEAVPGISGTFFGFGGSLLNNMGDVVFSAGVDTDNDGLSEVTGIFKESQGTRMKIVATEENTPTDIGTPNFLDVALNNFNDDGDIVFSGIWDQPAGVRHNGIFLVSGNAITNRFQSGEQITISDGTGEFTLVENGAINEQGDLAFTATVSIAANIFSTSHIFLALSGCRETSCLIDVAKSGDSTGIPGVGGTFDNFHHNDLFLTTNGDVVFRIIINGGETTVAYLLFERNKGSLRKIVAAGDEVAGTGVLNGVSSAAVAPIGRMAFLGKFDELSPASDGGQLQGAYYINDVYSNASPTQKIIRVIEEGDQIPGRNETLTLFRTGTTRVSINKNGDIAFNGKVFGADPLDKIDGVFVWTGRKTVQIVLEGECTPVGGAYGGAGDPHINNAGKVTFFNPRIDAAADCSPLATNSLSPVTPLSLWAQIGKVGNVFFPSPVQAQSAAGTSNIGEFATLSPLDPIPDICGGGPFERSDDWFLMDEDVTGVKNYKATYGIDAGPAFTITSNGCAAFSAGEEIRLHPGFRVERGGTFKANIE